MAKRRTCPDCHGSGKTFDLLAYLLDPKTWMPFSFNYRPWTTCRSCDGRGYYFQEWRPYSPKWRRKGG